MTRAAILPAGSDPYLLAYWLRHFRPWSDAVDELLIAACGPTQDKDVRAYMRGIVKAAGGKLYHLPRTTHGDAIAYLVARTKADHLLLCEDDAFICKPGEVDAAFRAIEDGSVGVIATPRDSFATDEVLQVARERFGEQSSAFWPCFVFVSRADLLRTDGNFGGAVWPSGATVPGLAHTCATLNCADTFVSASWQLRSLGLTVELRDNHRVVGPFNWHNPPWFHVGSLSGGYGWAFMGPLTPREYSVEVTALQSIPEDACKRMAWWQRAWSCWDGAIPEHHARYEAGFRQVMADVGMSQDGVDAMRQTFDHLVTWAES